MPGGAWPEELAGLFARAATLPTVAPRPREWQQPPAAPALAPRVPAASCTCRSLVHSPAPPPFPFLFCPPRSPAAGKAKKGGGAAAAEEEEEEALSEQERRLDAAAAGGSRAALLADDGLGLGFLDAGLEPGFAADGYGYGGAFGDLGAGQDWLGGGGAGGSAFARGAAEALAAAQQPGEYEEEFDVETER